MKKFKRVKEARKNVNDSLYVDKNRNIAVNLGLQDVKNHFVKVKKIRKVNWLC